MKLHVLSLVALTCLAVPRSAQAQEPLLAESFDHSEGAASLPHFVMSTPDATSIGLSRGLFSPGSSAFSLELHDASSAGRPEAHGSFAREVEAGSLRVQVFVESAAQAPAGVQLRSRTGRYLAAVLLSDNGLAGYDHGAGTVYSTVRWTPGAWNEVRIDWFPDGSFTAFVAGKLVARRVPYAASAVPGRVVLTSGYGSGTGQRAHFDDLAAMPLRDYADFQEDVPGAPPLTFWVDAPAGTSVHTMAQGAAHRLGLADQSSTARATAVKTFAPTPEGSVSLEVRVQAQAAAPFDLQLRAADHTFLAALRLGADGKLAYHNRASGAGAFIATTASWQAGQAHHLRVEWTAQDRFTAHLDGEPFVVDQPLATRGEPSEVALIAGTRASVGQESQVDDLVVREEPITSVRRRYGDNALWLSLCYACAERCLSLLPDLLARLEQLYEVPTIFLNVGSLDERGLLHEAEGELRLLHRFFRMVSDHELAGGRRVRVVAWVNGRLDAAAPRVVDLTDATVRDNLTSEAVRLVDQEVSGSHVASAPRAFDGVQLDLEPTGPAARDNPHFVDLLQRIRSGWAAVGKADRDLGIAAHSIGSNVWRWQAEDFYELAPLVDHFAVMTYSVGFTDGLAYRKWVEDQTRTILRSVSGAHWNDGDHPPLVDPPKVYMGLPAHDETTHHKPWAENIRWGAPGIDRALSAMLREGDPSASAFAGVAVYAHEDGSVTSAYASWDTDWWWLGHYWLGAW